ncbi:unnamed protein product (macronuclear) [Paramecium tetraurelia]|uniref:Protein kinase domain-containing protein n=1 Tax=Paramecium tetraurelia TaxID=5888 RepID=A0E8V0_PARTE|nr:uncharacterized protein GSPATT00024448001 [Paramecium tetraurelia]CAK91717.1 unnamed protein product [Paramecium tetraurelia]|eukprot:XP_001459114.1 hypothetical protein (macronuclear) [Paramecium tetraurelia strain d4-2]
MNQYKLVGKKGEGTFSEVIKSQSFKTGNYVAIKCMKNKFTSIEQVNHLREIQALRKLSPHKHIIRLIEVLYDEPTGRLALVFELMEQNLYEHIKGRRQPLNPQKVKSFMFQLLKSIDHMHRNGIFHRDIKPENILLNSDHLKLADFGSCKGIYSKHPYTEYISTRWYRAPECLLTDGYYDQKMDLWGVGCVMFEIIALFPLFPGTNELDQIHKIHNILGTPNPKVFDRFRKQATHMEINFPNKHGSGIERLLQGQTKECIDLIKQLLVYDPEERITAQAALKHEYFRELHRELYEADVPLQNFKSIGGCCQHFQHQENDNFLENTKRIDDPKQPYQPNVKKPQNQNAKTQKNPGFPLLQGELKIDKNHDSDDGVDKQPPILPEIKRKKKYDPKIIYGKQYQSNQAYQFNSKGIYNEIIKLAGKKMVLGLQADYIFMGRKL